MKKTICIDFDGVLHDYRGPWKGASVIEGAPVVFGAGAVERWQGRPAIDVLAEWHGDYELVILTTRGQTIIGQEAVKRWLLKHGVPEAVVDDLEVTDEKPPALIYIDDRAYRFEGRGFPTEAEIGMLPWNRRTL